MSKTIRRLIIGAGILIGTLVVLIISVGLFFDANRYKPQIESAVNQATGMSLKINGKVSLKMIPHFRVTVDEIHLSNAGKELFQAKTLEFAPRLFPFLLHRKVVIDKVSLLGPRVQIEKSARGHLNLPTTRRSKGVRGFGEVNSIRIKNGDLTYADRSTGQTVQIRGLGADLSGISWNTGSSDMMRSLTFQGNVEAQSLKISNKTGSRAAANFKASVRDDHGVIHMDPTRLSIFGGAAQGKAQIDLRSAKPKIEVVQSVTGIDLDQVAPKLKKKVSGSVDGSVRLTASGKDVRAITKTLSGTVSIRSQNVTTSLDVDGLAAKLKGAQAMDLVGLGSSLFSGQLNEATGQAAGIAGGAQQPKVLIRKLVSDWRINKGVAEAKDVAFATDKTTIAFKGDLNLVDKKYRNFYVATVDEKGCAKNKVQVGGSLNRPRPVAGSIGEEVSKSILGSAGSDLAGIFGGKQEPEAEPSPPPPKEAEGCDQFYSGSVIQ